MSSSEDLMESRSNVRDYLRNCSRGKLAQNAVFQIIYSPIQSDLPKDF
jgi:hypothetical protein